MLRSVNVILVEVDKILVEVDNILVEVLRSVDAEPTYRFLSRQHRATPANVRPPRPSTGHRKPPYTPGPGTQPRVV